VSEIERNKAFFQAVTIRAAEHVKLGVAMDRAIELGMAEEIAFEEEMLAGKTVRAKKARKVLCAVVFAEINVQNAIGG
jgi:hypothetical protein